MTQIHTIEAVRSAFKRARAEGLCADQALCAVATAFGLSIDEVAEAVSQQAMSRQPQEQTT